MVHLNDYSLVSMLMIFLCLGTNADITSWFHQTISTYFTITINSSIRSFIDKQVDHDLNNKIITISQPGYVATILDRFNINKISSKYPPKVPFSHYDIADDHPVPLSK